MLLRAKSEAECRAGCTSASRRCLRAVAAHRDVAARQAEIPFRLCLQLRPIPNPVTDRHGVWCLFLWFGFLRDFFLLVCWVVLGFFSPTGYVTRKCVGFFSRCPLRWAGYYVDYVAHTAGSCQGPAEEGGEPVFVASAAAEGSPGQAPTGMWPAALPVQGPSARLSRRPYPHTAAGLDWRWQVAPALQRTGPGRGQPRRRSGQKASPRGQHWGRRCRGAARPGCGAGMRGQVTPRPPSPALAPALPFLCPA